MKTPYKLKMVAALLMTLFLKPGFSQTTLPDATFGSNGIVTTDISGFDDVLEDVLVQPDGKIIAVGHAIVQSQKQFYVMRYLPSGAPDNSFGMGGKATVTVSNLHNDAKALALQTDGKIMVAGFYRNNSYNDPVVVRFNPDGTVDNSFGQNGVAQFILSNQYDEFHDIAIQPDGKIVLGGRT